MNLDKRLERVHKLNEYIKKCIERGEIKESMAPIDWIKFTVKKGMFIPIMLEKVAREKNSNFDIEVYGKSQTPVANDSKCDLCTKIASMMRRNIEQDKVALICDSCFDETEHDLY